jgi:hypothetical protein
MKIETLDANHWGGFSPCVCQWLNTTDAYDSLQFTLKSNASTVFVVVESTLTGVPTGLKSFRLSSKILFVRSSAVAEADTNCSSVTLRCHDISLHLDGTNLFKYLMPSWRFRLNVER